MMHNIGVMMSSDKGKRMLNGVDCVSNLHRQVPVREGVNVTLGMMRKPWSITVEMYVLTF
jgi:hypothetical protein